MAGALGAAATANLLSCTEGEVTTRYSGKPNVLFIVIDDMRPYLGCYGHDFIQSPNIDKLAQRSMVFENAHCQYPLCGPSRASLMTGMRPDSLCIYDLHERVSQKRPDVTTIGQYFISNGYHSSAIGKIYHNQDDDPRGWSEPVTFHHNLYAEPRDDRPATEAAALPDHKYPDCLIADDAAQRLEELKGEQPFFLAVGFHKPHLPFACPKKYWDLYDRARIELIKWPDDAISTGNELRGYSDIPNPGEKISDEKKVELIHGYCACASFVDAQVGKLLDALKRLELESNTIVVLWGDHGFNLGENNHWGKHRTFEAATRSPLIIAGPGINPGRTNMPAEFVDVFPTLTSLMGIETPAQCEGKSLASTLLKGTSIKECAFSQYPDYQADAMVYSMRTERYRLYVNASFLDHTDYVSVKLFDMQKDPLEENDLALKEEMQPLLNQLLEKFKQTDARRAPMCKRIQQDIGRFILKRKKKGFKVNWEKSR